MKRHLAIAALALVIAHHARAITPVPTVHGKGGWNRDSYVVMVSSLEHLRAVRWNEKENVPLPVPKAIAAAHAALKTMVGESHVHFVTHEVKLTKENGDWFYVVSFSSDHPSTAWRSGEDLFPAVLPFIVYLDGAVGRPEKALR